MNKKIFVTGGTGLLGSYLLRYLIKKGYTNVWALRRSTSSMAMVEEIKDKVTWIEGDILDVPLLEEVMEDTYQVYHCAAVVSFNPKDADEMIQVNQEGTANIVNLCLYRNVEKLVHVSSIAAIGRRKKLINVSEDIKWERSEYNSQYAISKYLAEQEVWRGMAEGLDVAIVNPSVIMGSGIWTQGPTRFFKQVYDGLKFYPIGTTGYVDVRDVARFMIDLMQSDIVGERFILNSDNLTYRTVFSEIANAVQKPAPSIRVNNFMKEMVWRVEWLRSRLFGSKPMVTRETANASMRTFIYENAKSLAAFDFSYTPVLQTIRETGEQYLKAVDEDLKPMYLPLL